MLRQLCYPSFTIKCWVWAYAPNTRADLDESRPFSSLGLSKMVYFQWYGTIQCDDTSGHCSSVLMNSWNICFIELQCLLKNCLQWFCDRYCQQYD